MSRSGSAGEPTEPWHMRFASNPFRCHATGIGVVILLSTGISLAWSYGHERPTTIELDGIAIEAREAALVVANAVAIRDQYASALKESQGIQERIDAISLWLPSTIDWETRRQKLLAVATSEGLQVASISKGTPVTGVRVAVLPVDCEVEGTYPSVCSFLASLTAGFPAADCSEIRIRRTSDSGGEPACQASISLRLPFAADTSAAYQLLQGQSVREGNTADDP